MRLNWWRYVKRFNPTRAAQVSMSTLSTRFARFAHCIKPKERETKDKTCPTFARSSRPRRV
jgi:hypothetical protein